VTQEKAHYTTARPDTANNFYTKYLYFWQAFTN